MYCYVVSPQKLDGRQQRVKTDGRDAKALCLKLDRYVQGNKEALAVIRVPSEEENQPAMTQNGRDWSRSLGLGDPEQRVAAATPGVLPAHLFVCGSEKLAFQS